MPVTIPALGASSSYRPVAASGAQLEERRARVQQAVDPLADRELAALAMAGDRPVVAAGAALGDGRRACAQLGDEGGHGSWLARASSLAGSSRLRRTGMRPRIGRNRAGSTGVSATMRRLPAPFCALVLAAALLGCTSERLLPAPAATIPFRATHSVLVREPAISIGRPCRLPSCSRCCRSRRRVANVPAGMCTRPREHRGRRPAPRGDPGGSRDRARCRRGLVDALQVEIERANYRLILSPAVHRTCPTAYDGQQVIYTFHISTGDRTVDTCKIAIDPNHPLFVAVSAVLRAAGG